MRTTRIPAALAAAAGLVLLGCGGGHGNGGTTTTVIAPMSTASAIPVATADTLPPGADTAGRTTKLGGTAMNDTAAAVTDSTGRVASPATKKKPPRTFPRGAPRDTSGR